MGLSSIQVDHSFSFVVGRACAQLLGHRGCASYPYILVIVPTSHNSELSLVVSSIGGMELYDGALLACNNRKWMPLYSPFPGRR